jgi:uncharacterized membrane protein
VLLVALILFAAALAPSLARVDLAGWETAAGGLAARCLAAVTAWSIRWGTVREALAVGLALLLVIRLMAGRHRSVLGRSRRGQPLAVIARSAGVSQDAVRLMLSLAVTRRRQ